MNPRKGPLPLIFLLYAVLLLHLPAASQAAQTPDCLECHKSYIDSEFKKSFVHQPFLAKKCTLCHSPDWVTNAAESDGKSILPLKTKKLGSNVNPAKVHFFSIPRDYQPSILFLEAQGSTSDSYRVKLKVPPFEAIEPLASDAQPPNISDVQVLSVDRSALVSAKIRWHTDELSSSTLRYGIGQSNDKSVGSKQFLTDHTVELYSLKPDATYNFTIQAQDIYGNSRDSRVFTFSTEKTYQVKEQDDIGKSYDALKLKSDIFRSEENYLLRITANQPVRMEISTYDLPRNSELLKNSAQLPPQHPPLKSAYESNMLVCETCHPALNKKFSHPVHFRARLGSKIPAEYPRLPNGQMSCLTCHEYHASNHPFHMRKSAERELCIGCHKRSFRN